MPVYKLLNEMPYEELQGWLAYFEKRPIGWRDDDRTFKLLQAQGVKEKPWNIFASLTSIYNSSQGDNKDGRVGRSFENSTLFMKLKGSVGGEKVL